MKKYDIVILTEARYEAPKKKTPYIENVLKEDQLLQQALEDLGLSVTRKDWNSKDFDWSTTKSAIFRTTWDYFHKFDEFKSWFNSSRYKCRFFNSAELILWNMDKNYLQELKEKGVHIPKTRFISKGNKLSLQEHFSQSGFELAILKPTISGSARHTYKIDSQTLSSYETRFQELIRNEDFMLQEFQNRIVSQGEISLVLIAGSYSHAVLKKAKEGDFRVQDDFGGSLHPYDASREEIAFAEKVLAACPEKSAYARVDIFYDNQNLLALGEIELIEPELWFRNREEAAKLLAKELNTQLQAS